VADYDYDQGGLGGLGGLGGVGGSGLGTGLGTGLGSGLGNGLNNGLGGVGGSGMGVLNGMSGSGIMNSDANNLLYIKENANNFSASFYMDDEIRNQLLKLLKVSNQTTPDSNLLLDMSDSHESAAIAKQPENISKVIDFKNVDLETKSSASTSAAVGSVCQSQTSVPESPSTTTKSLPTIKSRDLSPETTTTGSLLINVLQSKVPDK
jgi:hypothetical protein